MGLSKEFLEDARFVGVDPYKVVSYARFCFFAILLVSFFLSVLFRLFFLSFLGFIVSFLVYYLIIERIKYKAVQLRKSAFASAPDIITLMGISIDLTPNLERAFKLVIESTKGRIREDFKKAYNMSLFKGSNLKHLFSKIIKKWGKYNQGFKRGLSLIKSALISRNRSEVIQHAINEFFDGLINSTKMALAKARTNALILFSLGAVLPLIIMSLLPIVNLVGFSFNVFYIVVFLFLNLIFLYFLINYFIAQVPPGFSQLFVEKRQKNIFYPLLTFFSISFLSITYYFLKIFNGKFFLPEKFSTIFIVMGFGFSLSIYFYDQIKDLIKLRKKSIESEKNLLDVLHNLSIRLYEMKSFEESINDVVNDIKCPLTAKLKKAYKKSKELGRPLTSVLLNEIKKLKSKRVISSFKLILLGLKFGVKKSYSNILKIYNYLNKLISAEKEYKQLSFQLLSMMKLTSMVFTPIIGAFIVIMQLIINTSLSDVEYLFIPSMPIEQIILVVGIYVVVLTYLLSKYYSILSYGFDEIMIKKEISSSIFVSTLIFSLSVFGALFFIKS